MTDERPLRPSASVLAAFGLERQPQLLEGGQRAAWRVDDVVLKPVDVPEPQLAWQASLFERLHHEARFRVPRAIRSDDGTLVVDGWYATTFLSGRHEEGRWVDIIDVGHAFHAAIANEARPDFLDERDDPWSIGDRVAWGELSIDEVPEIRHLPRLAQHLRPIAASPQIIHGDLSGNVLFGDELPPAVIDLSPYFRPAAFATAVVVADALVWEGADEALLQVFDQAPAFPQYLLRALIYRVVTDRLFRLDEPLRPDADDPYRWPVELAIAACEV